MATKSSFEKGWYSGTRSFSLLWKNPSLLMYYVIPVILVPLLWSIIPGLYFTVGDVRSIIRPVLTIPFEAVFMNVLYFINIGGSAMAWFGRSSLVMVIVQFFIELIWIFCAAGLIHRVTTQIYKTSISLTTDIHSIWSKKWFLVAWAIIATGIRMFLGYALTVLPFKPLWQSPVAFIPVVLWYFVSYFVIQSIILSKTRLIGKLAISAFQLPFKLIVPLIGGLIPIGFFVGILGGFTLLTFVPVGSSFAGHTPASEFSQIFSLMLPALCSFAFFLIVPTLITVYKTILYVENE